MKLFGWKAPREGARPALSRAGTTAFSGAFSGAFAGDWPQGYEAQVRAGYRDNAVGQRAVRLIAESVGDAPLTASDPALIALVTARSGGQTLLGDVAAQLLLHGNAYVQLLRDADGGIAELFALRPERVSVEPDAGGWPAAYAYRVGNNVTRLSADPAPAFSTAIVTSASGAEARSAGWAAARTSYDVGPGIRSEADVATLLAFFRARLGPARGFRLRDPFDAQGTAETLGVGDGANRVFALVRRYGDAVRPITRPVAGTVTVAVGGVSTPAFALQDGGQVVLDVAPAAGAVVSASFTFDVPVRFAEDKLSVSRSTFLAGVATSVPLIEVQEA